MNPSLRILLSTVVLFLAGDIPLLAATTAPSPREVPGGVAWMGLRGPHGTGVYPDSKPPTRWDLKTGQNVRWIAPLDGWGQGQPVVADGKVFILLEPDLHRVFPRLQCLDLATGKLLWEDLLDHLPVAIPDEADSAKVYKMAERQNQATTLGANFEREYRYLAKTDEDRAQVAKRWYQRGFVPAHRSESGVIGKDGKLTKGSMDAQLKLYLPKNEQETTWKTLAKYGLWEEIYQANCNFHCIGKTFGAPVWCEGAVYVATAGGVFAKYDASGKRQWLTWSFPSGKALTGSGHDTCVRSPIIYGNLFISTVGQNFVVLDRATGRIVRAEAMQGRDADSSLPGGGSIASPAVLTIGKTDVLLTAGPLAWRLPDLKKLKVEGWQTSGMQALVKDDERDVVFFCGSGEHCAWPLKGGGGCEYPPPAAVRYTLAGVTLTGKVIWAGVKDNVAEGRGGNAPWLLYAHGRLYHNGGAILDALTGKIVAGKLIKGGRTRNPAEKATPITFHLLQLAGGHVYGWQGMHAEYPVEVFTADGKFVASSLLPPPTLTKEQLPIWQGVDSTDRYDDHFISYSCQFTFGPDCLVMRTLMHLYCFGDGARLAAPLADAAKQEGARK
jgi:hypothetical protein